MWSKVIIAAGMATTAAAQCSPLHLVYGMALSNSSFKNIADILGQLEQQPSLQPRMALTLMRRQRNSGAKDMVLLATPSSPMLLPW
jgi:hypothetical protein